MDSYQLSQLQGAWWSDPGNPTADFAIHGDQIWLDIDSEFHPCRIDSGNTLVYDLGPGIGLIERRIVALDGNSLILENIKDSEITRTKYIRTP